ncbi:MAG: hypothetical protein P4M11_02960 [Candidatus Pacebacteria bacterium]|nr:hypothetical protein [Candidatus Paceibacterota bacterium]
MNLQLDTFKKGLLEMQKTLSTYAYFYLNQIFTSPERAELYLDVERVFEKASKMATCTYMRFGKFFKTQEKMEHFREFYVDTDTNLRELKINALAESHHRSEEMLKGVPKEYREPFQEGLDLYRGEGDVIHGMAVDYCSGEIMALALHERGSREVNIPRALRLRNRTVDGAKLLDKEVDDWLGARDHFPAIVQQFSDDIRPPMVEAVAGKLFPDRKVPREARIPVGNRRVPGVRPSGLDRVEPQERRGILFCTEHAWCDRKIERDQLSLTQRVGHCGGRTSAPPRIRHRQHPRSHPLLEIRPQLQHRGWRIRFGPEHAGGHFGRVERQQDQVQPIRGQNGSERPGRQSLHVQCKRDTGRRRAGSGDATNRIP